VPGNQAVSLQGLRHLHHFIQNEVLVS